MSYLEKALTALGKDECHSEYDKKSHMFYVGDKSINTSPPSYGEEREQRELTPPATTICLDCRPTHPGTYACNGTAYRVGQVIEDTPALWRRAIHCPVCCPEEVAE